MEAERNCYLKKKKEKRKTKNEKKREEHCVVQRGSLLIEASTSRRGAAPRLIGIVPVEVESTASAAS